MMKQCGKNCSILVRVELKFQYGLITSSLSISELKIKGTKLGSILLGHLSNCDANVKAKNFRFLQMQVQGGELTQMKDILVNYPNNDTEPLQLDLGL